MAGPSDQDKLSDDWGLEDLDAAPAGEAAPELDESAMTDEERAAAAAAEWAAMLEGVKQVAEREAAATSPGRPRAETR